MNVAILVICDWLAGLLIGLGYALSLHWHPGEPCSLNIFLVPLNMSYMLIPFAMFIIIGFAGCNISILITLRKHQHAIRCLTVQRSQYNKSNRAIHTDVTYKQNVMRAKLLGIMALMLFVCYVPVTTVVVVRVASNQESANPFYNSAMPFTILLAFGNEMFTPLIFGWKDKTIKHYIRKGLHCKQTS